MMESQEYDPAAAYFDATRARIAMAARAAAPPWFYPTVGALTGAVVAVQSTRNGWIIMVITALFSFGLGAAAHGYRRSRGVSVQHRRGRAGALTAFLVTAAAVTIVGAAILEYGVDLGGAFVVAGILIAAAITVVGPAADRAHLRDQRAAAELR